MPVIGDSVMEVVDVGVITTEGEEVALEVTTRTVVEVVTVVKEADMEVRGVVMVAWEVVVSTEVVMEVTKEATTTEAEEAMEVRGVDMEDKEVVTVAWEAVETEWDVVEEVMLQLFKEAEALTKAAGDRTNTTIKALTNY